MDTSSNDAIRFAQDDYYGGRTSTNWYVLLFAVIITLFAVYWGFVRPTSRQLTKLRRYVTSLESSIADLNVQRGNNGEAFSMLEQMVEHEKTTNQATAALRQMRDLHRQIVQEANQLASARQALESLVALRTQVARQSSLIESTDRALGAIDQLNSQLNNSASETEAAELALEKLNVMRDGLIESISRMDDAEPILTRVEELHMRLSSSQEQLDELFGLRDKIEAQAAGVEKAETTLSQMVTLQDSVIGRTDEVATAIETLELATDVKVEMKRAGDTFHDVKHLLTEMTMMKPALKQAMDSLQPITELAQLRRLGIHELRRVANVISTRHSAIAHSVAEPVDPMPEPSPAVIATSEPEFDSTLYGLEPADYNIGQFETNFESAEAVELAEISEATNTETEAEKTSLINLPENEVVKALSEAAQQVFDAIEVAAESSDGATIK